MGGFWRCLAGDSQLRWLGFVVVSGRWEQAMCEYTQHLHEHFVAPIEVQRGRYRAPLEAGFSAQMRSESIAAASYQSP